MAQIILFNKPYGVLSQFTGAAPEATLSGYIPHAHFYAAGRLDKDSEGLLLLTDDGRLQNRISHPRFGKTKIYWVQVEGTVDETVLDTLRSGVTLKDGPARAVDVRSIAEPPLWPRQPPVRFRKHIPTSWLELSLSEGRNRQVRRMTAAVGIPTLRLVRIGIGPWRLDQLQPGQWTLLNASVEALH